MKLKFQCVGPVRGSCGHKHRSIRTAAVCAHRDDVQCRSQGGFSDRRLVVIHDDYRRGPTEDEADLFWALRNRS